MSAVLPKIPEELIDPLVSGPMTGEAVAPQTAERHAPQFRWRARIGAYTLRLGRPHASPLHRKPYWLPV